LIRCDRRRVCARGTHFRLSGAEVARRLHLTQFALLSAPCRALLAICCLPRSSLSSRTRPPAMVLSRPPLSLSLSLSLSVLLQITSASGVTRKLTSAVGPYEGYHMHRLVRDNGFTRTCEVGMANGLSALYITKVRGPFFLRCCWLLGMRARSEGSQNACVCTRPISSTHPPQLLDPRPVWLGCRRCNSPLMRLWRPVRRRSHARRNTSQLTPSRRRSGTTPHGSSCGVPAGRTSRG